MQTVVLPWKVVDTGIQENYTWKVVYHPIIDKLFFLGPVLFNNTESTLQLSTLNGNSQQFASQIELNSLCVDCIGFDLLAAKDGSIIIGFATKDVPFDPFRTSIYAAKITSNTTLVRPIMTTINKIEHFEMGDFGDSMLISIGTTEGILSLSKFPILSLTPSRFLFVTNFYVIIEQC